MENEKDDTKQHVVYLGPDDDAKSVDTHLPWTTAASLEESSGSIDWLVHGLIPLRAFAMLFGKPGTMKSFLALDLALAIARKRESWADRSIRGAIVIYVAAEGQPGIGARLRAYRVHTGITELPWNFFLLGQPVFLLDRKSVNRLIEDIKGFRDAHSPTEVFVVIDTLGACLAGWGDENNSQHMESVGEQMRLIREPGATVLLVHHATKEGTMDRGHGSLRDRADVVLKAEVKGNRLTLVVDKRRDGGVTGAEGFPRRLIPDGGLGTDVPDVATFLQKMREERVQ